MLYYCNSLYLFANLLGHRTTYGSWIHNSRAWGQWDRQAADRGHGQHPQAWWSPSHGRPVFMFWSLLQKQCNHLHGNYIVYLQSYPLCTVLYLNYSLPHTRNYRIQFRDHLADICKSWDHHSSSIRYFFKYYADYVVGIES